MAPAHAGHPDVVEVSDESQTGTGTTYMNIGWPGVAQSTGLLLSIPIDDDKSLIALSEELVDIVVHRAAATLLWSRRRVRVRSVVNALGPPLTFYSRHYSGTSGVDTNVWTGRLFQRRKPGVSKPTWRASHVRSSGTGTMTFRHTEPTSSDGRSTVPSES